jgi:hypothetical protein
MKEGKDFDYEIAFSFAGEDRAVVEELADKLVRDGIRVFYDAYEKAQLWGKDLYQHLQVVYRDKAQYCVIFVSASYADKLWPRHELKQAQARAFKENREYILPVRLDDTDIPGLNATVGYIDLRQHTLEELRTLIQKKLFGEDVDDDGLAKLTKKGDRIKPRSDEVTTVTIPSPPRTAYNPQRPAGTLLQSQLRHLEWAVRPAGQRRPKDFNKVKPAKTEAEAAARIERLTLELQRQAALATDSAPVRSSSLAQPAHVQAKSKSGSIGRSRRRPRR